MFLYSVYKKHISPLRTDTALDWKDGKKIFQVNSTKKQAGVAIQISGKIILKVKLIRRDNEGHYILVKGTINPEDSTILNVYPENSGAPNFINTTLQDQDND